MNLAVVILWGQKSGCPGHVEVLDNWGRGFTRPQAEQVAAEARRLGAEVAAVETRGAAPKRAAGLKKRVKGGDDGSAEAATADG